MRYRFIIPALLALPAAVAFYFWATDDARADQRARTRAAQLEQLRTALLTKQTATGVAALEADAVLAKLPSPAALGVTVVAANANLALVRTVATLATEPPIPIIRREDSRLTDPDDDTWLLRAGYISLRALERRTVTLLLAAYSQPDVCPAAIRLSGAPAVDAIFAARVTPLIADPTLLDPLCKRERQWRLAEAAKGSPLGFANGLFVHPRDRLAPGAGGRAAVLMQAMVTADEAWDPQRLGEALPVLLGQLAYEDAVFALAPQGTPRPALAAIAQRLAPGRQDVVAEACALSFALAQSLDPRRLVAELVAAYTVEHFPAEPRRSGALTLLYALSEEQVPKEAAVSSARLALLLEVTQAAPLCAPYVAQPAIPRALNNDTLQYLANILDRSRYIR